MSNDAIAALRAKDLCRSFGEPPRLAVRDFSLEVMRGEVVGLLGPNGAGKSTLLRMLAGILTPDSGEVWLHGRSLREDPLEAKRHLGFLSGDTQLYQRLTPREMLLHFGKLFSMPRAACLARIDQLIAELSMEGFVDQLSGTLSAGQRQRANIARAFLHDPVVLILDEPTNALDIISGRFIVTAIRQQRAAGKAILFSTHIMSEAEYLCDRIVMIHEGRQVGAGTKEALLLASGSDNLTDAFLKTVGLPAEGAAR